MKDLFNFLKDFSIATTERVKFPLFNSFALSWVVFNWKPILIILFSEQSIEGRISYILNHYSHSLNLIILPALVSVSYVLGLPFVQRELYEFLNKINQKNRDNAYDYRISSFKKKLLLVEKETEVELKKSANLDLSLLNQKLATANSEIERLKTENLELLRTTEYHNKHISARDLQNEELQRTVSLSKHDYYELESKYNESIFRHQELLNRYQGALTDFLNSTRRFTRDLPEEENARMQDFLDDKFHTLRYLSQDQEALKLMAVKDVKDDQK